MSDVFFQLFPPRLAEERQRLKLTQAQAATLCDVSRDVWGKYERGETAPGSQVLFHFAAHGADVSYLLTGVRSSGAGMSDEECSLLERFRNLPVNVQEHLKGLAQALPAARPKKTK